jgi:hypothetical protein
MGVPQANDERIIALHGVQVGHLEETEITGGVIGQGVDLLHNRKTGAVKSCLRLSHEGLVRDRAPCVGAARRGGEGQLFAVDAASARMEAKVNGPGGDPRAYFDALGLSYVVVFHAFKYA